MSACIRCELHRADGGNAVPAPYTTRRRLLGMISMELYGHFVGSFDPAGPFFAHAAAQGTDILGLAPPG